MIGLPVAGLSTLFYVVLLVGMGATKLWRWGLGSIRRIGKRREERSSWTAHMSRRGRWQQYLRRLDGL